MFKSFQTKWRYKKISPFCLKKFYSNGIRLYPFTACTTFSVQRRGEWVQNGCNESSPILKEQMQIFNYFTIRGGSLKKIAKKIIPNVPINKKV
jgi:hypothetical protein